MEKKKYFIITIDTEGDNLWAWRDGDEITTENTLFLPRFQALCDRYSFKPVWLTNWEMINDGRFVAFAKKVLVEGRGEIGMHLHAWNTPPHYPLVPSARPQAPYLIEYPAEVMEAKISTMTEEIERKTGIRPTSHRAGRWATDGRYLSLLEKYGYSADCSVTPHVDWSEKPGASSFSRGSDYSSSPDNAYFVSDSLLEVPVTIMKSHRLFSFPYRTIKGRLGNIWHSISGNEIWLRPDGTNLDRMLHIVRKAEEDDRDYIMFMLHSSELMPLGSPTFRTEESVENLYSDLEKLFDRISESFTGITLRDYAERKRQQCVNR